jgi:hypothetical protein
VLPGCAVPVFVFLGSVLSFDVLPRSVLSRSVLSRVVLSCWAMFARSEAAGGAPPASISIRTPALRKIAMMTLTRMV